MAVDEIADWGRAAGDAAAADDVAAAGVAAAGDVVAVAEGRASDAQFAVADVGLVATVVDIGVDVHYQQRFHLVLLG